MAQDKDKPKEGDRNDDLIDWFTVGAQALNFLILVWLMKRLLYKPGFRRGLLVLVLEEPARGAHADRRGQPRFRFDLCRLRRDRG